ncbi:unnamed protein product [Trichobilharzia szidati]|nr:unnamed protein product [Trichobilharzia szidati]
MNKMILNRYRIVYLHLSRYNSIKTSRVDNHEIHARDSDFKQPPGYLPPHIWMKQRQEKEALKKALFGESKKEHTPAEKTYLSCASHASLSGAPVTEDFSYEIVNNITEIPKLDMKLLSNLNSMGLFDLTPVQKHAIGIMSVDEYEKVDVTKSKSNLDEEDAPNDYPLYERITGKYDLMAAAQTGSGKTLAYLLPSLNRLLRVYPYEAMQSLLNSRSPCQYPSSLILAPTRELVQQILSELLKLCNQTFVRPVAVYGGDRPEKQLFELQKGCHLIVATPGRLLDFLQRDAICLKFCRSLILDEADRMLDMGFEKQIRQILESPKYKMPPPLGNCRQTVLFSATFPREVSLLAKDFMRGPKCISLTLTNPEHNTGTVVPTWGKRINHHVEDEFDRLTRIIPKEIDQRIEVVNGNPDTVIPERLVQLIQEIKTTTEAALNSSDDSTCRILVFCNTKREVDAIDKYLYSNGVQSAAIHGDKSQVARGKALDLFRKGRVHVLVASSVAARGIDIPNVRTVINIGLPREIDDYVHRIGRTGRMGKTGEAVTLINDSVLRSDEGTKTLSRGICQLFESIGISEKVPQILLEYANMDIGENEGYSRFNNNSNKKKGYSNSKSHSSFSKGYKTRRSSDDVIRRYS